MDHDSRHDETVSPTLRTTPTNHSGKPDDHIVGPGTPKSNSRSVDTSADEDDRKINMTPRSSALSTRSPVHFVLGNFFFAMFLISLVISVIFFAVAWFTVLRDAWSMDHPVPYNGTGVSQSLYHSGWTLLMTVVNVAAGVDTRPQPST